MASALLLPARALGSGWTEVGGPVIDLDREIPDGIEGCAALQHLVLDPVGFPRSTAFRWFSDGGHEPIGQFSAVFADIAVASEFTRWLADFHFPEQCSTPYFDRLAGTPCCAVAVLPRIAAGEELEIALPERRETSAAVRRTDVFWTDASGARHGPEVRLTAVVRVGRAITTLEAIEVDEAGTRITDLATFGSWISTVIDADTGEPSYLPARRADLPALGPALGTTVAVGDIPRLAIDLANWVAVDYQSTSASTVVDQSSDDFVVRDVVARGEGGWEAPTIAVMATTSDVFAEDFSGDPVQIGDAAGTLAHQVVDGIDIVTVAWHPDSEHHVWINATRFDPASVLEIAGSVRLDGDEIEVEFPPNMTIEERSDLAGSWVISVFERRIGESVSSLQIYCSDESPAAGLRTSPTRALQLDGQQLGSRVNGFGSAWATPIWSMGAWTCELQFIPQGAGVALVGFTDDEIRDVLRALIVVDQPTLDRVLADARTIIDGQQLQP